MPEQQARSDSATPSSAIPGPPAATSSAWETRVEDLVPAEVLAELRAQVAARARTRAETGAWPPPPPRMRVHRLSGAPPVRVELGDARTDQVEALQAAMAALGVSKDLTGVLTRATLACATLTSPSRPAESEDGRHAATGDPAGEAPTALTRAKDLLGVVETVSTVSNQLDGVLVRAVRDLTAARGRLALADKGVTDPQELTAGQRAKWARAAKSATRHELEAALGWYASEIRDLVGLASSPVGTLAPVLSSLASGESSWQTARRFYRAAGPLPHEDTAAIANGLFGDDPAASVTDRLDSAGKFTGDPWRAGKFSRALDREVAKYAAADEEAQQAARDRARANQDLRVRIDADGTAEITIGCAGLTATAVADRIGKAAKAARAAGAPELLRDLRAKVAAALLLHGTLDTTTLPEAPDLITVEQSAELTKVLNGLPAAEIHVVVPYDTLLGHRTSPPVTGDSDPGQPCTCQCPCPDCSATTPEHGDSPGAAASPPTAQAAAPGSPPGSPGTGEAHPRESSDRDGSSFHQPGATPGTGNGTDGERVPAGVGEVIGRHPMFLMPQETQLLALLPGSTLHRLLIDPATGRCVERSIDAYPFDRSMRVQIIASDLFCRAPGCLRPARLCQMDHVQEHGTPGGHTCEANGQPACDPHHDQKTKKAWDAAIHANRDVTWTTLLGRIYRTKAHDYRQYTQLLTAATAEVTQAVEAGSDPDQVIGTAIYQALSYRDPGYPLASDDDEDLFDAWDTVTLAHVGPSGRRTYRPDPTLRQNEINRHHATRGDSFPGDGTTGGSFPGDGTSGDCSPGDDTTSGSTAGPHVQDRPEDTGTQSDAHTATDARKPWADRSDEPPPF